VLWPLQRLGEELTAKFGEAHARGGAVVLVEDVAAVGGGEACTGGAGGEMSGRVLSEFEFG